NPSCTWQRRARNRRKVILTQHLCRPPARRLSWAFQVERRLHTLGDPLLRPRLSTPPDSNCPLGLHGFLELVAYDLARTGARDLGDQLHRMGHFVSRELRAAMGD